MGAPRKHPPTNAKKTIEELAAQGHSIVGIAKRLGVTRETFKRWCEDDEALQEAFEVGRETERQTLHALIVQSAVMNKPANVNAFFILKARHGYRENDSPNTNVNVAVAVPTVMQVIDHGTDEQWAAKAAAQQRNLALNGEVAAVPRLIEPSIAIEHNVAGKTSNETELAPSYSPWGPPIWKAKA